MGIRRKGAPAGRAGPRRLRSVRSDSGDLGVGVGEEGIWNKESSCVRAMRAKVCLVVGGALMGESGHLDFLMRAVTLGKSLSPPHHPLCKSRRGRECGIENWPPRNCLSPCLPVSRKSPAQVQWEGRCRGKGGQKGTPEVERGR